jgi:hypothetical protein
MEKSLLDIILRLKLLLFGKVKRNMLRVEKGLVSGGYNILSKNNKNKY